MERIGDQAATAGKLDERLCELPSVTEVGMKMLAPVAQGSKLELLLDADGRRVKGFRAAGFQVSSVSARQK